MCRYAWGHYKDHYACFDCRKCFKRPGTGTASRDWTDDRREVDAPTDQVVLGCWRLDAAKVTLACPHCGGVAIAMGLDFRAPVRGGIEAWEVVRRLRQAGVYFADCGCGSGLRMPTRWRDVPAFLAEREKLSDGERLARRFAARAE